MLRSALSTLARHSAIYALSEQLGRLAGFLLLPLITGHLSPEEFGVRELLAVSLTLAAQIAGLHLGAGVSRFYFESSDPRIRSATASTAVFAVAAAAAILVTPLLLLSEPLATWLPGAPSEGATLVHLTCGIFAFQCIREVTNKVLQTQQRSTLFAGLSLSKLSLEVGLQVTALVVFRGGLSGLLLAVLTSEALFAAIGCGIVLAGARPQLRWELLSPMLAYSLPLIPNGALQFGLHSADRYVLGALSDDRSLGLYALAYKLGYIPNYLLLGPFLLIWYPFIFALPSRASQREAVGRLAPIFLLAMGGACLATALFAEELVAIATGTSDYSEAAHAIPWVAGGYWIWGLYQFLQTGLYVEKCTARLPWITLAALIANLYLNAILVPTLGFLGAAVATPLTFLVLCAASHESAERVFPVEYPWPRMLGPAALGVAAVLIAELVPAFGGTALGISLRVGLLMAWLGAASLVLTTSERRSIGSALGSRIQPASSRESSEG